MSVHNEIPLIGTAPAPYPNAPQGAPIIVSPNDPPIPNKLAQRVWKGEYIDLSEFLPELLGASDPISQGIVSESKELESRKCPQSHSGSSVLTPI